MNPSLLQLIIADLRKNGPDTVHHADVTAILQAVADGDLVPVDAATPTKGSFDLLMDRIEGAQ